MLLIPIGQEDNVVRRHPVVCYALMGLNLLVFLGVSAASPGRQWALDARKSWRELVRHLVERPDLELPAVLAQRCDAECRQELQQARDEHQRRQGPPPAETLEEDRQRFQENVAELERLLARQPTHRLGYVPSRPEPLALLSSLFVHAGWMHLLGNMLFLFVSGPFVEDLFGRPIFTGLYFVSGAAATLTHAAFNAHSVLPLVGASGAIAGVMGAFLVRLTTARIRFLFLPIPIIPTFRYAFALPAFVVLPLWLLEQFWYATTPESSDGVAWWAHVGGFCIGAVVALGMRISGVEERYVNPSIEEEIGLTQNPAILAAEEARLRGNTAGAATEIDRVLAAEPGNVDAWREAYEIGLDAGDQARVGRAALRLLELYDRMEEPELAHELVWDALRRFPAGLPARFLFAAARHFERRDLDAEALPLYGQVAERFPDDPLAFGALFRRGELLRRAGQHAAARQALQRARAHPACTEPLAVDHALGELDEPRSS